MVCFCANPAQAETTQGEQLYQKGDYNKGIIACTTCHGPKGVGNAEAGFPVLRGQHAVYTIKQLRAFKEAKRTNDLNRVMQNISAHMSQEEMEAVAHYIESLH
jgi:cytochrome c553